MKNWFLKKKEIIDGTLPSDFYSLKEGIINRLASRLGVSPTELASQRNFSELGLDSIGAVRFVGDVEEWLELELDPTIMYTKSTIEQLLLHLSEVLGMEVDSRTSAIASV